MFKRNLAEMIGTFALVFCGTGAIIINEVSNGAVTHIGIAITFGLIILSMIYTLGDISGAHFNPAVTIGFMIAKRINLSAAVPYVFSQLTGAILASATLYYLFPQSATLGATIPAGTDLQSFVLEIILTFFLMFVILNVSTDAKEKGITAGIAIASVVGLEAMFAGPISGASMNPARSLAPSLIGGNFNSLWVYLTAPFIGAAIAVVAYKAIQQKK